MPLLEGSVKQTTKGLDTYTLRKPLGVIVAITPFNFPLILSVHKFAPALAAGKTIVHKPASSTPLSALKVAEIMQEAGVPDGVFNLVPGPESTVGHTPSTNPNVHKVAITGSTANPTTINKMGLDWNAVLIILDSVLNTIPAGAPMLSL